MGDATTRKCCALGRLRSQLKKKQESLADQFDFKMYIIFHFKGKKSNAIYEVAEVLSVMTNNFEESIKEGVKHEAYSEESTKDLIEKDTVQLHAAKWKPLRTDLSVSTTEIEYFLWPRRDIDKIECCLFSKWKEDPGQYKKIEAEFTLNHSTVEEEAGCLLECKDDSPAIINNSEENVFLFVDKVNLQTSTNGVSALKLYSVCIYLPQDRLMCWGRDTIEQTLQLLQSQSP